MKTFFLSLGLTGFLLLTGCSHQAFDNANLALDSAEGRAVVAQLALLKTGGPAGVGHFLQANAATDSSQTVMLKGALEALAAADTLELRALEKFGPDVLRILVHARRGSEEGERAFLLVRKDGRLLWAAPN